MATVLVTSGEMRSALAIVRSLGRAGHRVLVGSDRGHSLAGASRFSAGEVSLGDPLASPASFLGAAREIVRREGVEVLLPVTEADLLAILPSKRELEPCVVPFPELTEFMQASDKGHVARIAESIGIAVPAQMVVGLGEIASVPELASAGAVLKPARSVQGGRKLSVSYVREGEPLRGAVSVLPSEAFPVLVQERISGPGVGVFMLRWEGEVRAAFAHQRVREKPPSGGVSVLRESIQLDPEIRDSSVRLLEALDWRGVAMIEFKLDTQSGRPFIMEVNGRFWGSLQLALDAGVDFPGILVGLALGRASAGPPPAYRAGVRSRWLMGDVDHLLMRMLRSDADLNLESAPSRPRVLLSFLSAFLPPTRLEVLRAADPRPFLREARRWAADLRR